MQQSMADLAARLESLLKLRSIPFGMKLFESRAEMEAIPRIRRPKTVHTLDQVVGAGGAARLDGRRHRRGPRRRAMPRRRRARHAPRTTPGGPAST